MTTISAKCCSSVPLPVVVTEAERIQQRWDSPFSLAFQFAFAIGRDRSAHYVGAQMARSLPVAVEDFGFHCWENPCQFCLTVSRW